MIFNRRAIMGLAAAGTVSAAFGQTPPPTNSRKIYPELYQPTETIDLWPMEAPGQPSKTLVEKVIDLSDDSKVTVRAVFGVSKPRLVVFRPATSNGAAMLVVPGGGYIVEVIDNECYEMGRLLAARGFTVFVLIYRLPGDGWAAGPNVALSDAQRAMRVIRASAKTYGLDPAKIGAMGFSAGGHVCADLATRYNFKCYDRVDAADDLSARPAIAAPIYPVISMDASIAHAGSREKLLGAAPTPEAVRTHSPQHNVPKNAPPFFLLHAEDDDIVPVENTLVFRTALRNKGIATETHLFARGGHGFGLRQTLGKPVEVWPELFLSFARTQGFPV